VKKLPTKADIRADMEQEMTRYLKRGGHVEKVPRGVSGRDEALPNLLPSRNLFIEPSIERTPVPEVIAAIESRRGNKTKPPVKSKRRSQRHRKTVYDDFGEPLRHVWVDE
jgi:hypothetical protein